MENLITSQHYINDEIVAEKIAAGDFEVQVSPEFEVDGVVYRVVMDGHHSLKAAIEAGVDPMFIEQTVAENDRVAILNDGDIESFLEVCWMDGPYVFVTTEEEVW